LLLALKPRSGRIREADRLRFALRASVLVDLALAHRISMNANRIKVLDTEPTGDKRLDAALDSLTAATAPSLAAWIKGTPAGYGMINRYLSILADQGVVHIEQRRGNIPAPMHATLLDQPRRDAAKAKLDRVAHGRESEPADHALAGLAHACGLDRHLYRFSPLARRRIAQPGSHSAATDATAATSAVDDAVLATIVTQAISNGITQLNHELTKLLRHEYRVEHTTSGGQHHHAGGYSDSSGGGHHHSH